MVVCVISILRKEDLELEAGPGKNVETLSLKSKKLKEAEIGKSLQVQGQPGL